MGARSRRRREAAAAVPPAALEPVVAPPVDPALERRIRIAAAAAFVVSLAAYLATLAPSVAGGDSGELIVVSHTLGVAHPPGYPLYTLLGWLFTLLPFGGVAWKVNLLSAVCGAGAAAVLCLGVAHWARSVWPGVAAAGLFAFSPRVWPYAVTAEVFALHNLLLATLVWRTVRFVQATDHRRTILLACALGAGLAHHQTFVFYGIPAGMLMLWRMPRSARAPRVLAVLTACILSGLLFYLYLPVASARVPALSWGDQTTVDGFFTHLLRREYGTFTLVPTGSGADAVSPLGQRLGLFARGALADLWYAGPVLALLGIAASLRRGAARVLGVVWLSAFLFYVLVFNSLANVPIGPGVARAVEARFWQQPYLLLCAWAGLGLAALSLRLPRLALPAAALLVALGPLVLGAREQDRRQDHGFRDFARAVLEPLPPGAMLLGQGDHVFHTLKHLQLVEGTRADVRFLDQRLLGYLWHLRLMKRYYPDVVLPGLRLEPGGGRPGDYSMTALLDANIARAPIHVIGGVRGWDEAKVKYQRWPWGMTERVLPRGQEPVAEEWMAEAERAFSLLRPVADVYAALPEDSWEHLVALQFWKAREAYALTLGQYGTRHDSPPALRRAAAVMEDIVARGIKPPVRLHKDLGAVYQKLSSHDPAAAPKMRESLARWLAAAPPGDPDIANVRAVLESARR